MRQKFLALLFITLASFGCQHSPTTANNQVTTTATETTSLPPFEAKDSEGRVVRQENLTGAPSVGAFFDVDSVLAWRSLAKLEQAFDGRRGSPVNIIGIGAVKSDSPTNLDVNSVKREYQITFPVIFDENKKLSTLFQAPNCCDYIYLYDSGGAFKSSEKLSTGQKFSNVSKSNLLSGARQVA